LVYNHSDGRSLRLSGLWRGSVTNLGPSGRSLRNTINANYLAQAGTGELLLQGDNHLTAVVISGGAVLARSAGALGGAPVLVTGGELQLIFGFNYAGSALTLAGGALHGGIGGSQTFEGPVALTADATINVDGGNSVTLANAAGLNGGSFNLTKTGAGALILPAANNSWASLSIAAAPSRSATAAPPAASVGQHPGRRRPGVQPVRQSHRPQHLQRIRRDRSDRQRRHDAHRRQHRERFAGAINVTNGTLRINGTSGSGAVTVAGGSLGGTGTMGGPVTVLAGGALAPGDSVGTLTLASDLNLGGNLSIEVNRSLTQSNDVITGERSGWSTSARGIVAVSNLGPALGVGNRFNLFGLPVTGGEAMAVGGAGVIWTNKLAVDGSIEVLSTTVPRPVINSVTMPDAASLVMSGNNGYPGSPFYVLSRRTWRCR